MSVRDILCTSTCTRTWSWSKTLSLRSSLTFLGQFGTQAFVEDAATGDWATWATISKTLWQLRDHAWSEMIFVWGGSSRAMHFQRVGLGPRSPCTMYHDRHLVLLYSQLLAVFASQFPASIPGCFSKFSDVFGILYFLFFFASFFASCILEVMEVFQISPEPDSWAIPPLVEYLDAPQTWALWQHCRQYNCSTTALPAIFNVLYRHVESAWHGL